MASRRRTFIAAAAVALIALAGWQLAPRATQEATGPSPAQAEARPAEEGARSWGPAPPSDGEPVSADQSFALVERWTDRFVERAGESHSDPDFFRELFQDEAALAALAAFLGDDASFAELPESSLHWDYAPPEVSRRPLAITMIEALLMHPRAPEEARKRAGRALARTVARPQRPSLSPDVQEFDTAERALALAILLQRAPDQAREAYASIQGDRLRRILGIEVVRELSRKGMPRHRARRLAQTLGPWQTGAQS